MRYLRAGTRSRHRPLAGILGELSRRPERAIADDPSLGPIPPAIGVDGTDDGSALDAAVVRRHPGRGRRAQGLPPDNDGGQATLEVALITPVLLLLVVGLIQFALWYNAEQTVIAAAQEGAAQASTHAGDATAGQQRAQSLLQGLSSMTTGQQVTVSPAGTDGISVSVSARLDSLIPGFGGFALHATATSHAERASP